MPTKVILSSLSIISMQRLRCFMAGFFTVPQAHAFIVPHMWFTTLPHD